MGGLEPEERNRICKMLNFTVLAHEDGAASNSTGLLGRTFVEIANLYLDGVLHLQQTALGFVPCFPMMAAKK